jgi:hypothetical protein
MKMDNARAHSHYTGSRSKTALLWASTSKSKCISHLFNKSKLNRITKKLWRIKLWLNRKRKLYKQWSNSKTPST